MELNLYGVASNKLDKMRGRDMKLYFALGSICKQNFTFTFKAHQSVF